ncbi:TPM domain-containing protein [Mesobacillus maritimus]|uniref:TPM domain-containing protein n=1 Tax=Mesobacillus maritimus TaxID=1643336 RepID=A0ABS7K0G0_9BACI|nr:TPM domain-containing protein [Mesobacillus maritimus]MBY0095736.1 TPM domain-containing protein [Mesobacillus maritimus]
MVKMKKSFLLLPLLLMLLVSVNGPVFASYEKVYDEAGLFSEEERADINTQAIALSEQTEMDIVIVTTNDSQGKPSSDYALDFYDEHGFGYEDSLDGVMYLLNMEEREVYIFTRDKGTDYIDAGRVEELLDVVYPPLGDENYRESVQFFLDEVESMMASGPPVYETGDRSDAGYAYTEDGISDESSLSMVEKLGIYLLISLALGGIVIGIMMMGNRGRSTVNARTYLQDNSFAVTKKRDQHYNTIVTQQKIQQNNNSGGSSISGGGGGIGGGGRKF